MAEETPHIAHPTPHIAFIGMSGVGKSYWAKQLAEAGWLHLDCDAAIGERLGALVKPQPGEELVHAVGRWMGMPWADGFGQREQQYLDLERKVTQLAISRLPESDHALIDTTGSVIYTGDALLDQLKQATRVVYFDVPDDVQQQMVSLYLCEPKPVLWRGMYRPRDGESQDESLARCYADLLADRAERYRVLADVVIDYHAVREPGFGAEQLLEMIA